MGGKGKKKPVQATAQSPVASTALSPSPVIHEATLLPSGAVIRGNVITQAQAEILPSEIRMLFFTPELYRRYNANDEALAADADWESAIVRYHEHLTTLRDKMPSQVIELSKLCLHDGEILQRKEEHHPLDNDFIEVRPGHWVWPLWYGSANIAVRMDDTIVSLFYFLHDNLAEQASPKDRPFSKEHEHWLYDEIHWQDGNPGRFTHLILLSSGVIVSVPFSTVVISRFPSSPLSPQKDKQIA